MIPHRAARAPSALLLLTATALALASGCARSGGPGGGPGGGMPPVSAETAVVTRERVLDRFEAVGSVQAGEAITVVAEIDGVVTALPFREGQPVRKGALLARLDDAQLRAEMDRAAAFREQNEATYKRVKAVVEQRAGSAQDLDDAAAALKVAEANLALARTRLSKTRVVAPFSGIVGSKRVSPGAYLRAGTPITDLAQIYELKVVFSAPERYLSRLQPGAVVTVSAPAFPGTTLQGRIDVVDPVLNEETRSAQVIARVRNPGGRFRPGMSANVSAVLSERMNSLTVPNEAVFAEGDQMFVYVVSPADHTVSRVAVKLGTRLAEMVEVLEGLKEGDRIVRAGHQKLFPGAKVAVDSLSRDAGGPGAASAAPAGR